MTLQARMSAEDRRLYNPSRDVAHNFQQVMELVAGRLEDRDWVELNKILHRENVSMDDLGEACGAYCQYLANTVNSPNLSMFNSLEQSGFFKCKPAAQVAVLAMIGTCYAGMHYVGIREATIAKEGPMQTIGELVKHSEQFRRYIGMPRWKRWFLKWKTRIQAGFAALSK
jgi:hypothetical protein